MATPSGFLNRKAEERKKKLAAGDTAPDSGNIKSSQSGPLGRNPDGTASRASSFLEKKAAESRARIDAEYGRNAYGGSGRYEADMGAGFNSWLNELNDFSARMGQDWDARNGVYQDNDELEKYLIGAYADLGVLQNRADKYRRYFSDNREVYGDEAVKQAEAALDEGGAFLADLRKNLEGEQKYWAQFENEEEYNSALAQQREYERLSALDEGGLQQSLDKLEEQLQTAEQERANALYGLQEARHMRDTKQERLLGTDYEAKADAADRLAKQAAALRRDLWQVQRIRKAEQYNAYRNEGDFTQYSAQGAGIENPSFDDVEKGVTIFGHNIGGKKPGNIVTYSRDNWEAIYLGEANGSRMTGSSLYRHMTNEQVDIYNYLLAKEGEAAAQEYLDFLQEDLNRIEGNAQGKAVRGVDNGIARTGLTALYGTAAGLNQFKSGMEQLFSEERLPTSAVQFGSEYIREDLAETGPKILGSSLGQAAYDVVTTTANMAPSILLSYLTAGLGAPAAAAGAVGSVALGASAGGNAYNAALQDGYTPEEARNYSILVGASEGALQYALGGIGKLGGKLTGSVAQNAIKNIDSALLRVAAELGINMAGEGVEEYLQDILEPAFRNLVFDEDNEIQLVSEDAAYSFLLGAVTAGLMEGGHIAANGVNLKRAGASLKEAGRIDALMERALALDPKAEAHKLAADIRSGAMKDTDINVGQLLNAFFEAGGNMDFMSPPKEAAQETAAEEGAGDILAEAAAQAAERGSVSNSMAERILSDEGAASALGVAVDDSMTKSQRRAAVKSAVEGLAGRESAAAGAEVPADTTAPQNAVQSVQAGAEANAGTQGSMGTGKAGRQVLRDMYDPAVPVTEYYAAMDAYYQAGVRGEDAANVQSGGILTVQQQEAAYLAGLADGANGTGGVAKNAPADYTVDTNTRNGGNASEETGAGHFRGQRRTPGVAADGQGTDVEAGAGSSEAGRPGSDQAQRAAGRRNRAEAAGVVSQSTRAQGVSIGTDSKTMKVLPSKLWDEDIRAVVREKAKQGIQVVPFIGQLEARDAGGVFKANGWMSRDGKRMLVRADHDTLTMRQLADHEEYHAKAGLDKQLDRRLKKELARKYGRGWEKFLANAYAEMYFSGQELTKELEDYILQEILADAYAGIDVLRGVENVPMRATDISAQVRERADKVKARGPPSAENGGRFSREVKKIEDGMSDEERTNILKDKFIPEVRYEGQADKQISENDTGLQSKKKSLISAALKKVEEIFDIPTEIKNSDYDIVVTTTSKLFQESVSKDITDPVHLAKLVPVLEETVQNAVGIESHSNRYFYDHATVYFHNLIGGYVDGDMFIPVRFGIKQTANGKNYLYVVIDSDGIKKAEVMRRGGPGLTGTTTDYSATYNVADILGFVNSPDILKYVPDAFLSDAKKRAKWDAIAKTIKKTNDKNDAKYLKYISEGNLAAAKAMVVRAANAAGYTIHAWHGSRNIFNALSKDRLGTATGTQISRKWFFAGDKETATSYYPRAVMEKLINDGVTGFSEKDLISMDKRGVSGKLYEWFIKMENPLEFDAADYDYAAHAIDASAFMEISDQADANNNDGIILRNVIDNNLKSGERTSTDYLFREPSQAKSADVITYDDDGNIIPISQRFNVEVDDLRFSRDSEGSLTQEQVDALQVGADIDTQTESVYPERFSRETWEESEYVQERKKAIEAIAASIGVSKAKAGRYIDAINSVSALIADDRARLDYEAAPGLSPFVSNSEYGGSFDFSTLCKKRRLFTGTFTAVQKALKNTALTAADILKLRNMMKDAGLEVSCGFCYVEGSRANMGQFTQEFIRLYKKYHPGETFDLTMADLNTPDGIEWVRINRPEVYTEYVRFWNNHGRLRDGDKSLFASQQKPKLYQARSQYDGEILKLFGNSGKVSEKNKNGGIRFQSFSDFEIVHLIDNMQVIMDMSRVGLAGQAYTKVPDFAWAMGDTGLKINLSLVANGVDANGRLTFDGVEGMPIEDAIALRNTYGKNVGTIVVVFGDEQLMAAMADPRIDFIIPFHRSQWKKSQYEALGIPKTAKDYTRYQNEKLIRKTYHEYRGRMVPDKATNYMPNEYWDFSLSGKQNAEKYLKMCAENNKRPKFYQLLSNNGDGSYSLKADGSTDGYWKLLIDFKMYDNDGNGSPQMPVRPNFSMDEIMRMLNDYKGGHLSYPVANGIVDQFVAEYKQEHPGEAFSREADLTDPELQARLTKLLEEYGAIKPGENPFRNVNIPQQTEKENRVSQTVRTILEAKATPDEVVPTVEQMVADGEFSYRPYSDKQAVADARAKIEKDGWAASTHEWFDRMKRGSTSKANTTMGWLLYDNAANSGDTALAMDILNRMVESQRDAAQALQATRILKQLAPETQLYGAQRSVNSLQEEISARYGDQAPELHISEELAEKFLKARSDHTRAEALKDIYRDIGRQMPSRFMDKFNAWRYIAMLANPRTHVRNIVGNAGFAPVVAVKDTAAAFIEGVVLRRKGGRTKAFGLRTKTGRALIRAAWADYANVKQEMPDGKYSDLKNANRYIEEGRQIFGRTQDARTRVGRAISGTLGRAVEKVRVANSRALTVEDQWFAQPHYAAAMAQYCLANGITAKEIASGKGQRIRDARAYAMKEAQKATYQDTNDFSSWFSNIARTSNPKGTARVVSYLSEGVLPFRKTPANILVRGVEYSPIGLLNGVKKALLDVQSGRATAAEAIDSIAAGLTGTALVGLGIWLASLGLVRGHGDDEKDKEKKFKQLQGVQYYALELPDGTSATLDWLAPEALPFFVGVNLYESTSGMEEAPKMADLLGALTNTTEPLLEMSCLQGLNDIIESVGYASSNGLAGIPQMAVSSATSLLTQLVPTFFGQVERSGEPTRMTTYTDKNKWIDTDMQYFLGKLSAKIPGLDYSQIPYIDEWGRTEYNGGPFERIANNMLNPAYMSEVSTSETEEELQRLYDATGDGGVLPGRAAKYFTVDGERVDLTAEQYVEFAAYRGRRAYQVTADATSNAWYRQLDDKAKASVVKACYDTAQDEAKALVSDYTPDGLTKQIAEAQQHGISAAEYILFYKITGEMKTKKDSSGKVVENKAGQVREWLKDSGLPQSHKEYLWSTQYKEAY